MIGLIMAGGRGSRMRERGEKLALGSRPMILRVIDAVVDSGLCEKIIVATSEHSPRAKEIIENDSRTDVISTQGCGYVEDLAKVLQTLDRDVMIVPGDLALLEGQVLRDAFALRTDVGAWTVVMSSAKFAESLGAKPSYVADVDGVSCAYTGVSIVNASLVRGSEHVREDAKVIDDARIALNVNTPKDYRLSLESLTDP